MLDLKSLIPWRHKGKEKTTSLPAKREHYTDPFQPLRQEMDKLFDTFSTGWGGALPGVFESEHNKWFPEIPAIDVKDQKKKLIISAELPGVDENDINVTLEGDLLTIRGEKTYDQEEKEDERYYRECRYGSFSRQIRLPFDASQQDIKSRFRKGILTLEIEKPADAQSRVKRIAIAS